MVVKLLLTFDKTHFVRLQAILFQFQFLSDTFFLFRTFPKSWSVFEWVDSDRFCPSIACQKNAYSQVIHHKIASAYCLPVILSSNLQILRTKIRKKLLANIFGTKKAGVSKGITVELTTEVLSSARFTKRLWTEYLYFSSFLLNSGFQTPSLLRHLLSLLPDSLRWRHLSQTPPYFSKFFFQIEKMAKSRLKFEFYSKQISKCC